MNGLENNLKRSNNGRTKAVAYLRTSSAANVGADKDSEKRQRKAIAAYARAARFEVAEWFYDAAISGVDAIQSRPGFNQLLDRIENNGVRIVLVEDASRFARDLMTQETGITALMDRGVKVFAANGDDLSASDDPMKVMMRQVAGAFAQLEKARLVLKLRGARERKRVRNLKAENPQVTLEGKGKCEGRKSIREKRPEVVEAARAVNDGRSLDKIAAALAAQGHVTPSGKPYSASAVKSMLGSEFKSNALERRKVAERKKKLQGESVEGEEV
jgi:DNA invertase Pin-like site-specific DNA recombinase